MHITSLDFFDNFFDSPEYIFYFVLSNFFEIGENWNLIEIKIC